MSLATVLRTWRIGITGPMGVGVMDVPSLSEETAKRRAYWTAASLRWGDLDELEVSSCVEIYSCCAHCGCESLEGHVAPCVKCAQPLIETEDQRVAREMAVDPLIDCPACEGHGEHGVRQDYWGNWETKQCRACDGMGEVTPELAAEITAALADRDES